MYYIGNRIYNNDSNITVSVITFVKETQEKNNIIQRHGAKYGRDLYSTFGKKNMGQLQEKEGEKDTKYQSLGSLWLPRLQ